MDTDLQPNAGQPRLTRKVNALAGVCISVYLCVSVVSPFQLPFLGSCLRCLSRTLPGEQPTVTPESAILIGHVTPRRVRTRGLHPPQNRHLVGRVPSPGGPILSAPRTRTRAFSQLVSAQVEKYSIAEGSSFAS